RRNLPLVCQFERATRERNCLVFSCNSNVTRPVAIRSLRSLDEDVATLIRPQKANPANQLLTLRYSPPESARNGIDRFSKVERSWNVLSSWPCPRNQNFHWRAK